jgi:amino acid transporter
MTGWAYWTSNLPYFPSILLFAAGASAWLVGDSGTALASDRGYVLGFSLATMWLATLVNIVGLRVGKWLHNAGALGNWIPVAIVLGLAAAAWSRDGSATDWASSDFVPHAGLKEMIFWTGLVFALSGVEASAFLRSEVRDFRRLFPRALITSGAIVLTGYVLGAAAILVILPAQQVSGLDGVMKAVEAGAARFGWSVLVPVTAMLLVVANVGSVGAWLTAAARLPFMAGIDRYLPEHFGRIHPRWGTPHVSFLWQAMLTSVFIVMAHAGSTVTGAYQALIGMGIITYFLPYLFMFASVIKVQAQAPPPEVVRPPGGRVTATVLAAIGFSVTAAAMVLACVPDAAEPNKPLAVLKVIGSSVLLIGVGQIVYLRRRGARLAAPHRRQSATGSTAR